MRVLPGTFGHWGSLAGAVALFPAGLFGVLTLSPPRHGLTSFRPPADTQAMALAPLLGLSGNLRVIDVTPPVDLAVPVAERDAGVYATGLVAPDGMPIHILELVPLEEKHGGTWQGYRVGFWPGERGSRAGRPRYPLPDGFLEVTPQNQDLPLTTRFRVRDFLTKDQATVWPKVLVIRLPLLDKLELIAEELERRGRPGAVHVMSGFRTPQYNAIGVGPRGGRARNSRHMYGDAADIFVDADGDGRMDDLDRDGRVTVRDARWLAGVAARVEELHPVMAGGIGVYRATSAHGPFVHVDTRGTTARW